MGKLTKNYSIFIIRLTMILSLTMIGMNITIAFYSTLTGDPLTVILSTIITLLMIKVNKEVQ